jgi:hypothetical protein
MAAEGRPKGADAPMNQSREAHHTARPLHSPEGPSMLTHTGGRTGARNVAGTDANHTGD